MLAEEARGEPGHSGACVFAHRDACRRVLRRAQRVSEVRPAGRHESHEIASMKAAVTGINHAFTFARAGSSPLWYRGICSGTSSTNLTHEAKASPKDLSSPTYSAAGAVTYGRALCTPRRRDMRRV